MKLTLTKFLSVKLYVLYTSTVYNSVYCVLCIYICCVISRLQVRVPSVKSIVYVSAK